MALVKVNNGDSGLDARNKINAAFDKADLNETDIASIINGTASLAELNVSGDLVVSGTASLNDVVIADGATITGSTDNLTIEVFGVGAALLLDINRYKNINLLFVDGDLKAGLELDPVENVNGTRFYTEDIDAEQLSQLYLSPQSTNLQSFDSNFSVYNSVISTSFSPGFFGSNDSTSFTLQANNLASSNTCQINGIADLVTDDNQISISAQKISLGLVGTGTRSFKITSLPTFADNAAAITAGLPTDGVYKTATGELRIVV